MHSDVAYVLYYASILKARLQCGQTITALEDHLLVKGLDWAVEQTWINDDLRTMFKQGQENLTGNSPLGGQI